LVKSKNFNDFFDRSSKFLENVLNRGDGNMIESLLKDDRNLKDGKGVKDKIKSKNM
jgi:hypothetical protein